MNLHPYALAVDLVLIAVFALTVYRAWKRGFVGAVSGLLALVGAAVIAYLFAYIPEGILLRRVFVPFTEEILGEIVQKAILSAGTAADGGMDALSQTLASLTESAGALGIPLHGPIALPDVVDPSAMALLTEQITAQLTSPIAGWLARIAAYLLTFFAAYLILRFVLRIVDLVMKLPLLREANTLLGGICGVLLGAGYAWITAQALSLVLGILVTNGTLPSEVMGGVVFGWMTNLIA